MKVYSEHEDPELFDDKIIQFTMNEFKLKEIGKMSTGCFF